MAYVSDTEQRESDAERKDAPTQLSKEAYASDMVQSSNDAVTKDAPTKP